MLALVLGTAACHRADLTDAAKPELRRTLALATQARGDTTTVSVTLDDGPSSSIGSVSATLHYDPAWRFVGCEGAQGAPLLACQPHTDAGGAQLRLAAAWAEGTHAGALVRVVFARHAGSGPATGVHTNASSNITASEAALRLIVGDVHSVRGGRLTDSLDVRGVVGRASGAMP